MSTLEITVLGCLPGFLREPGCVCARCRDPDPRQRAHTAVSIAARRGDWREHHLVDCGEGIAAALYESQGPWPLDSLWITHSHPDHVIGLNSVVEGLCQSKRRGLIPQELPLRVFCSALTWQDGPARLFPHLVPAKIEHRQTAPGERTSPGMPELTFTALPVVHWPGACIYVVEGWAARPGSRRTGAPRCKVILAWDMWRFTRAGDSADAVGWEWQPGLDEDNPLLSGADLLIAGAFAWRAHPGIKHLSVEEAARLAQKWRAKRTLIVHYLGHADQAPDTLPDPCNTDPARGPVCARDLSAALQRDFGAQFEAAFAGQHLVLEY